jgi:hypothetical protein
MNESTGVVLLSSHWPEYPNLYWLAPVQYKCTETGQFIIANPKEELLDRKKFTPQNGHSIGQLE